MFKALLSPQDDPLKNPRFFDDLQYPLWLSYKYDGIRGVTKNATVMSREYKPLPSLQVQTEFSLVEHTDSEIIIADCTHPRAYSLSNSHVMSVNKPGDLRCYVFDYTHPDWLKDPFYDRHEKAMSVIQGFKNYIGIPQTEVNSLADLLEFENEALELGFEGIMMRNPLAPYKQGRASYLMNIIYKLKRFTDDEALVVDFEEANTNTNEAKRNPLGYIERSTAKSGLVPSGMLGKFICLYKGKEIRVSAGVFTHEERREIWLNRDNYRSWFIKFRYFGYGVKDLPRYPRAVGWRHPMDFSA